MTIELLIYNVNLVFCKQLYFQFIKSNVLTLTYYGQVANPMMLGAREWEECMHLSKSYPNVCSYFLQDHMQLKVQGNLVPTQGRLCCIYIAFPAGVLCVHEQLPGCTVANTLPANL